MHITYTEACRRIAAVAAQQRDSFVLCGETVPLAEAVGRIVKTSVFSPVSTPTFDSSAMDGFAVCSTLTASASPEDPLLLRVVGSIVAGEATTQFDTDIIDGLVPCVEIMTGAAFPLTRSKNRQYDACVPYEHTSMVLPAPSDTLQDGYLIQIEQPVKPNQHRRLAGGDYSKGDPIVEAGVVLSTQHIMAAASVGVSSFHCFRRIRVGVLSTGSELVQGSDCQHQNNRSTIPDVNGPYVLAAIRELGAEGSFIGTVGDVMKDTLDCIEEAIKSASFDIIVSSGAVSASKMDHIPEALETLQADIHFHHVAMRPGHPALLATVPVPNQVEASLTGAGLEDENPGLACSKVTFFGLPGNPIAAAACFRFLFVPYYNYLLGASQMPCTTATLSRELEVGNTDIGVRGLIFSNSKQIDQFRYGRAAMMQGELFAQFNAQQSPAKIKPFTAANCWIHVPRDTAKVFAGDQLHVYSLCANRGF